MSDVSDDQAGGLKANPPNNCFDIHFEGKKGKIMKHREIAIAVLFVVVLAGSASAAWEDGRYWADDVTAWTGDVQNYGFLASPELMTESTTWWLTGTPDGDQNGNGYGWDAVDQDSVAGWRAFRAASFTVHFDAALKDVTGDDLLIVTYGGPNSVSSVWASPDDVEANYIQIGTIGAGTPGYFDNLEFDFGGLVDDVHYVKVVREVWGPQTGRFIDAVGGVPEPASLVLLACGAVGVLSRRRGQKR